ncbi:MAG: site-2 protease family protein [Eubacteriales bacterium]
MIFTAIRNGNIALALYILISVLISLTVHEYFHGYVAYKCGDSTARSFGRLTLNPIKHLDLFGFLSMLLVGFGWAKPVPIVIRNFKKPRRDIALVSLAGPVSNFILAFLGALLMRIAFTLWAVPYNGVEVGFTFNVFSNLITFFYYFTLLNLGLGLFNLIPIPPLDGSKVLASILPPKYGYKFIALERYAGLFILALFLMSNIGGGDFIFAPLEAIRGYIYDGYNKLIGLLPFIY